jgi:hypothetical protein
VLRRTSSIIAKLWLVTFAAAALLGCPDDNLTATGDGGGPVVPTECAAGILGDDTQDMQLEIRALKADGTDVALNDGDDLAILFPPQGGRVAFVGVRALNLDGCGVQVTGAIRDLTSKQVRVDGRTVNLTKEADGWGTSGDGTSADLTSTAGVSSYSNVPLCPNQWADVDIFDQPFEIEVQVKDRKQKMATKTIKVTPRCAQPGSLEVTCKCLCKHGYVLGEACSG